MGMASHAFGHPAPMPEYPLALEPEIVTAVAIEASISDVPKSVKKLDSQKRFESRQPPRYGRAKADLASGSATTIWPPQRFM